MTDSKLPFKGVRILDFTQALAGPLSTMYLSMLGADCIRIGRPAPPARRNAESGGARSLFFSVTYRGAGMQEDMNVNKRSIILDLKRPEAVEIVKRLVRTSDAVVENYRPGVMDRLGIGYDVLRAENPGLVMMALAANGASGPDRFDSGYAAVFGAMAGFSALVGYEGGPPVELRIQADLFSGTMGAFALMSALVHKQKTGEGLFIDSSNREMLSMFIGDAFLDYFVNHRNQGRRGNNHPAYAPHNTYRCAGEDNWISIAVKNDAQWRALANAIDGALVTDPRFADGFQRWQNRDVLDRIIGDWTASWVDVELMNALQAVGVPATQVMHPDDVYGDPHVAARDWWRVLERGEKGPHIMGGRAPWLFGSGEDGVYEVGSEPGADNEGVLAELLGMSAAEVTRLTEAHVLG